MSPGTLSLGLLGVYQSFRMFLTPALFGPLVLEDLFDSQTSPYTLHNSGMQQLSHSLSTCTGGRVYLLTILAQFSWCFPPYTTFERHILQLSKHSKYNLVSS